MSLPNRDSFFIIHHHRDHSVSRSWSENLVHVLNRQIGQKRNDWNSKNCDPEFEVGEHLEICVLNLGVEVRSKHACVHANDHNPVHQ